MYRSAVAFLFMTLLTSAPNAIAADKVYKTKDKDGNVVFTDVPPASGEAAKKAAVEVRDVNTYQPGGPNKSSTGDRVPWIVEEGDEEPEFIPYRTLMVISPAMDAPLRDNTGNVNVQVSVEPFLLSGHRLRLLMDGVNVGEATSPNFFLPNVDRGTHSLVVEVIDADSTVLQSSPASTFHMQRFHLRPKPKTKPKPSK